jgi:hypothetical protein
MGPSGAARNHMRCGRNFSSTTTYDALFQMSSPKKRRFLLLILNEHMTLSETRFQSMFIHHLLEEHYPRTSAPDL